MRLSPGSVLVFVPGAAVGVKYRAVKDLAGGRTQETNCELCVRLQAINPASNGEDHEGESCFVCAAGANQEGPTVVQQRTYRAVPIIAELRRVVQ